VPTISQLVRKGREKQLKKVKTPAFRVVSTGPKPGHPDLPTRGLQPLGQRNRGTVSGGKPRGTELRCGAVATVLRRYNHINHMGGKA